ncbi:MbtH family protein [Streptomyces sp. BBFR2]|uniref:MbtH family protein n=1 Tax=Streptomyces sp. BBFR2 TaxID=3372854 RepID=UPI0037DA4599
MTHPFEDEKAACLVLVNQENQHSLRPAALDVPAGWTTVHGPEPRQARPSSIEESWTDPRPAGLTAAMSEV